MVQVVQARHDVARVCLCSTHLARLLPRHSHLLRLSEQYRNSKDYSHSFDIQTKVASWNQKIMMVREVLQTLARRRERESHVTSWSESRDQPSNLAPRSAKRARPPE